MTPEEFIKAMRRSDEESETAKALSKKEKKLIYDYISKCARGSEKEKEEWSEYWFNECLKNDIATGDLLQLAKEHDSRYMGPATVTYTIIHADD